LTENLGEVVKSGRLHNLGKSRIIGERYLFAWWTLKGAPVFIPQHRNLNPRVFHPLVIPDQLAAARLTGAYSDTRCFKPGLARGWMEYRSQVNRSRMDPCSAGSDSSERRLAAVSSLARARRDIKPYRYARSI
jgi:hypothetical protein